MKTSCSSTLCAFLLPSLWWADLGGSGLISYWYMGRRQYKMKKGEASLRPVASSVQAAVGNAHAQGDVNKYVRIHHEIKLNWSVHLLCAEAYFWQWSSGMSLKKIYPLHELTVCNPLIQKLAFSLDYFDSILFSFSFAFTLAEWRQAFSRKSHSEKYVELDLNCPNSQKETNAGIRLRNFSLEQW